MAGMNEEEYEHARRVQQRVEDRLLALPGVHGVSIARKNGDGALAIVVHVSQKRLAAELPEAERIPAEIEGVPTDVIETAQPQPH